MDEVDIQEIDLSNVMYGYELVEFITTNKLNHSPVVVAFKTSPDAGTYLSNVTGLRINGDCLQLNEETFEDSLS